jgi:glycerophosphoryl diester phosphodiesterase
MKTIKIRSFQLIAFYGFLVLLVLNACNKELSEVVNPRIKELSLLQGTRPLPANTGKLLEGIYSLKLGNSYFGDDVVVKYNGQHLSLFAKKNCAYAILKAGERDSLLIFEGYWRFARGNETGILQLSIPANEGGNTLLKGEMPENLVLKGNLGKGNENPATRIEMHFQRKFSKLEKKFYVIAHRGGGRNIDRLPASENSLEIIKYAPLLGANAIEIDVKLTKDKVPVLFHDNNLSKRLINEDYFIGKISDYSFVQLRSFCTLKNGERIPTLEEALQTVIDSTDLKLVWLDLKTPDVLPYLSALQQKYLRLAAEKQRDIEILIGLPADDIFGSFLALPGFEQLPALCELETEKVLRSKSKIWAPRWSLGLLNEKIGQMHQSGIRVFAWTLDEPEIINTFFAQSNFDGILSNFPTLIAYEYYSRN